MSAAAQALGLPAARGAAPRRTRLALAFAHTSARHLLLILPRMRGELAHWRAAAASIPSRELRSVALDSLAKRGNIEGAALFATLAPRARRADAVRALVAYQVAYNYLDTLADQSGESSSANTRRLHEALLHPFLPQARHHDYYAYSPQRGDGGYLTAAVEVCRQALAELPSRQIVAATALEAAERVVEFQSLNLSERRGGHAGLKAWAGGATPAGSGLEWWETAAGAGSSLVVHALIAAAANPALQSGDAAALDAAYHPWIGALHTLLDSVVDRDEDRRAGQRSLLDYYQSPARASVRLAALAQGAADRAQALPDGAVHRVILTTMCSYYLSAPECDPVEAATVTAALARVLGAPLAPAAQLFRCRRAAWALARRAYI